MAEAVLVCRECNSKISHSDKFCPQCGAKVAEQIDKPEPASTPAVLTCEVCGHENRHSGSFCEACGVKLPRASVPAAAQAPLKPELPPISKTPVKQSAGSPKLQTRHYVGIALIVAVVGVFIYVETQREIPRQTAQTSSPAQQSATQTEHAKEILAAIERLQRTVKENPNDIGSKLLLANALHDGAMHDAALLPRAIDAYKVYLKENPNDPNARVDLGICYFELGKIDSLHSARFYAMAIDEMLGAVKESPSHQAGAFNLGIVYLFSGNMPESNRWFKKAADLNPESELGRRAKAIMEQHGQAG
ncbi:MAG: zinc ribbon domain-containing protein [Bacteroidetes bacterium]|nr:zinc ribbon domain-containing protein [Bacteroidota bacterium]MCW5895173.1 zinc ribbon domain-containing protein [Bacteroidota bacterium]